MREKEYTADEQRVCDYIQEITKGLAGCGDDPIGFLIASHGALTHYITQRKVRWHKTSEQLPNDGQDCFITKEGFEVMIRLPFKYYEGKDEGVWIDFFATPEAGAAFNPEDVDYWIEAEALLPEEEKIDEPVTP